jgi:hypothetical protein
VLFKRASNDAATPLSPPPVLPSKRTKSTPSLGLSSAPVAEPPPPIAVFLATAIFPLHCELDLVVPHLPRLLLQLQDLIATLPGHRTLPSPWNMDESPPFFPLVVDTPLG